MASKKSTGTTGTKRRSSWREMRLLKRQDTSFLEENERGWEELMKRTSMRAFRYHALVIGMTPGPAGLAILALWAVVGLVALGSVLLLQLWSTILLVFPTFACVVIGFRMVRGQWAARVDRQIQLLKDRRGKAADSKGLMRTRLVTIVLGVLEAMHLVVAIAIGAAIIPGLVRLALDGQAFAAIVAIVVSPLAVFFISGWTVLTFGLFAVDCVLLVGSAEALHKELYTLNKSMLDDSVPSPSEERPLGRQVGVLAAHVRRVESAIAGPLAVIILVATFSGLFTLGSSVTRFLLTRQVDAQSLTAAANALFNLAFALPPVLVVSATNQLLQRVPQTVSAIATTAHGGSVDRKEVREFWSGLSASLEREENQLGIVLPGDVYLSLTGLMRFVLLIFGVVVPALITYYFTVTGALI